jgi:hypothetical protein
MRWMGQKQTGAERSEIAIGQVVGLKSCFTEDAFAIRVSSGLNQHRILPSLA